MDRKIEPGAANLKRYTRKCGRPAGLSIPVPRWSGTGHGMEPGLHPVATAGESRSFEIPAVAGGGVPGVGFGPGLHPFATVLEPVAGNPSSNRGRSLPFRGRPGETPWN